MAGRARVGRVPFQRHGFTLVEALIAVLVVAILAAISVPAYRTVVDRTRAVAILNDLQQVQRAADQYHMDHQAWPPDDAGPGVVPETLERYVTGLDFEGSGYVMDWFNWTIGQLSVAFVMVTAQDPGLRAALDAQLANSGGRYMSMGGSYLYFIALPPGIQL